LIYINEHPDDQDARGVPLESQRRMPYRPARSRRRLTGEADDEGKVRSHNHIAGLDDINTIFSDLKAGKVDGRMVMTM